MLQQRTSITSVCLRLPITVLANLDCKLYVSLKENVYTHAHTNTDHSLFAGSSALLLTCSDLLTDGNIHVLMENCWVTRWQDPQHDDENQIVLVQQGCTRSPGTSWVRFEVSARNEEMTPERLMIYRDLPHGSYVHCQLAMCDKRSSAPSQQVCLQYSFSLKV